MDRGRAMVIGWLIGAVGYLAIVIALAISDVPR